MGRDQLTEVRRAQLHGSQTDGEKVSLEAVFLVHAVLISVHGPPWCEPLHPAPHSQWSKLLRQWQGLSSLPVGFLCYLVTAVIQWTQMVRHYERDPQISLYGFHTTLTFLLKAPAGGQGLELRSPGFVTSFC